MEHQGSPLDDRTASGTRAGRGLAAHDVRARLQNLLAGVTLESLRAYLWSLGALALVTVFGLGVRSLLAPTNIALIYLLVVVFVATTWGLYVAIFCSVIAVLTFNVLFVPPYNTLAVHDPQYLLTFAIFLVLGILISELSSRLRAQAQAARRREQETAALYALSQSMAWARDTDASLDAALAQLNRVFDAEAVILRADPSGSLQPYPPQALPAVQVRAAQWVLEHKEAAGVGTAFFVEAERLHLPLLTAQGVLGVLSLRWREPHAARSLERQRLLQTFADQIAVALEHAKLSEQAEQARVLEASERLRNALLSSLSHDLRTPLAAILGSATSLLDREVQLDAATRLDLLQTIREEATRLNRYVGNLLNMTRLEAGVLKPQRDWHSIEEVVGSALARVGANGHPVNLDLARDLPLVPFDFVLVEQVLVNLLDNAYKFSPTGAPIQIGAHLRDRFLEVSVADQGISLPPEEYERIFDKFYQYPHDQRPVGMGLGLSIARGIVEAHGGVIWAGARAGGGTEICFTLPLESEPVHE